MQTLAVLAEVGKDFIYQRVVKDVLPRLTANLTKLAHTRYRDLDTEK